MRRPRATSNYEVTLAFVAGHPDACRLTVAQLVGGTGLTRPTLYRALARHGGVNEFLMSIRLEAAKELLASHLTCKEVAKRCGFRTQAHFNHRFHTDVGVTPGNYQAQRRAELAATPARPTSVRP